MKKIDKKLLKLVEQITRHEITQSVGANGDPPFCTAIFHQPKRPIEQKKDN